MHCCCHKKKRAFRVARNWGIGALVLGVLAVRVYYQTKNYWWLFGVVPYLFAVMCPFFLLLQGQTNQEQTS